jgi:hypothetical protein
MLPAGSLEAEDLRFQATGWQQVVIFSILTLSSPDDSYAHCGGNFCFELRQQLAQKHCFSLKRLWCHNCEGQTSIFTTIKSHISSSNNIP